MTETNERIGHKVDIFDNEFGTFVEATPPTHSVTEMLDCFVQIEPDDPLMAAKHNEGNAHGIKAIARVKLTNILFVLNRRGDFSNENKKLGGHELLREVGSTTAQSPRQEGDRIDDIELKVFSSARKDIINEVKNGKLENVSAEHERNVLKRLSKNIIE